MNTTHTTFVGAVIIPLLMLQIVQDTKTGREPEIPTDSEARQLAAVHNNPKLNGVDNTAADEGELRKMLKDYDELFFKGETRMNKFLVLSGFCQMVARSPDGKKLVPDLMGAIDRLEAPVSVASEVGDWDKYAIRSRGDRVGLLIQCVLEVAGKEGFEQMFAHFEKKEQFTKHAALLERVSSRRDRKIYLELLSKKLVDAKDPKLKAAINSSIDQIREDRRTE